MRSPGSDHLSLFFFFLLSLAYHRSTSYKVTICQLRASSLPCTEQGVHWLLLTVARAMNLVTLSMLPMDPTR